MSGRKYDKEHEWILLEGDVGVVGISNYAQEQLGDVVYVELPTVGQTVAQSDEVAVVESVKSASEIYAPAAGEVVEINERLNAEPGLVNTAPTGDGWFFRIKLSNPSELDVLMDEAAYAEYVKGLD